MKTLPLLMLMLALAVAAHAQEVTVTAPTWLREDAPPDHLPQRRHHTLPSYPREARKSGEVGYVFLERHITAEGNNFRYMTVGSQMILARAVLDDPWITEMKPAEQAGKPVDADIWYAFIFNPESATRSGPEATPRLLQVTPIFVQAKGVGGLRNHPSVPVKLTVDEKGAVVQVELQSPDDAIFLPAIQKSTAQWIFAPARHNGQAVRASLAFPVVLAGQPNELFAKGEIVPPRVIKRVRAFYPFQLRRRHERGVVTVEFNVGLDGKAQDVAIKSSSNAAFEEEAMIAVKKYQFAPATKNGQPVVAHMQIQITFQMFRDNHDEFEVRGGGGSELPPEYRYDTPPHLLGAVAAAYPYDLLRDRQEGSATVEMVIDPTGHVIRTQVLEATKPALGAALAAAVEMYQFDPAMKDGKATQAVLKREQSFRLADIAPDTDRDTYYSDYYLLHGVQNDPNRLVSAKLLDHPLRPISRRPPVFPANLLGRIKGGHALVEVVIDKDGRARIPRVLASDDPAFGYAAVQAAEYWRFDPPTVGGKKVLTKAQIPFTFSTRSS